MKSESFGERPLKQGGVLSYEEYSPHPQRVKIKVGGVEMYPEKPATASFREMRGLFAGKKKPQIEWDSLLNV